MDFIQGLPMSRNKHNTILVVVDRLTKVAHFIPRNLTDGAPTVACKFVQEILDFVVYLKRLFQTETPE